MNRGWQSGTRIQPQVNHDYITSQIRAYLTDCRRFRQILSPDDHPTLRSCLKVVFGPEAAVTAAYRQLTTARAAAPEVSG